MNFIQAATVKSATVHFKHFREFTVIEHMNGVKVVPSNFGGCTVAFNIIDEQDDQITIDIGFSVCSETDNFSRAKGRDKATERLTNDPQRITLSGGYKNMWDGEDNDDILHEAAMKQVYNRS